MQQLRNKLAGVIPEWRNAIRRLQMEHRDTVVAEVTLGQLFKGLRGVNAIVCDTSYVDPAEGIFIRGIPVLELVNQGGEVVFYIL